MQKISKTQFLELVDLTIACRGFHEVFEQGRLQAEDTFTESLDAAIAEYVFWAYDRDGSYFGDPEQYYPSTIPAIFAPWVEGYEKHI